MNKENAQTVISEISERLNNLPALTMKEYERILKEWKDLIGQKFCKARTVTVFDLLSISKDSHQGPDSPFDMGFTQWSGMAYSPNNWLEYDIVLHAGMYVLAVQYDQDNLWPDYIDVMEGEGIQPPLLEIILMHDNKAVVQVYEMFGFENLVVPEFLETYEGTWEEVILKAHEYQEKLLAYHKEFPQLPDELEDLDELDY